MFLRSGRDSTAISRHRRIAILPQALQLSHELESFPYGVSLARRGPCGVNCTLMESPQKLSA